MNQPIILFILFINKEIKLSFRLYPPKNKRVVNIHINTKLVYSAKKKNTNITEECSVMNPLTSSDSASARSKGALLVSAIEPMKNITNTGNRGKINHIAFWASTIFIKFSSEGK